MEHAAQEFRRPPEVPTDYLAANTDDLLALTERLLGYDTQNPPRCTVEGARWLERPLEEPPLAVERFAVAGPSMQISSIYARLE